VKYKPKADSSPCSVRLGLALASLLTMMAASSLAAVAMTPLSLAAGPETRAAGQAASRSAPEALSRPKAESFDGRHSTAGKSIWELWMILVLAVCLLAPVIGWWIPWRSLRIPLALLVAGPAWFAGGLVGSSIDGGEPMMGACCMGAVFWPITTIALSEGFHHLRGNGKRMRREGSPER